MRAYKSENFLKILVSLHKSDTLSILFPTLIFVGIYSSAMFFLQVEFMDLNSKSEVRHLGMLHSVLGFVLSLLMVFRTNSAYDRWWEGRKLWGKLVNDSRNFMIKIATILDDKEEETKIQIAKYLKLFPHSLATHLSKESTRLVLDEDFKDIKKELKQHAPVELILMLSKELANLKRQGKILDTDMLFLDTQLSGFLDVCGGCERIKNTPIPFSYSSFIKKFVVFYVMALPVANVVSIGYFIIPITMFVCYVLMSLELIAEEIEDPFNNDENDIPMESIAQNIERSIDLILNESIK